MPPPLDDNDIGAMLGPRERIENQRTAPFKAIQLLAEMLIDGTVGHGYRERIESILSDYSFGTLYQKQKTGGE